MHTTPRNAEIAAEVAVFPDSGASVVTLVDIVETVIVVPVAVAILAASVVLVQVPEHPPVYAEVSDTPVSVITKVTIAPRLSVADEAIEMPVLYEEHGAVHAPTATP